MIRKETIINVLKGHIKKIDEGNHYSSFINNYSSRYENEIREMYLIIVLAFVIEMSQVAKKATKKIENEKFIFSEEIIYPENKNDIKNIIYTKHREYDITHLLDSYKYFSE